MISFAKARVTANNILSASNLRFMSIPDYIDGLKRKEIFNGARENHYIMFCTEDYNGLYKISGLSADAVHTVFQDSIMSENVYLYLKSHLTKKVQKELGFK